MTCDRRKVAECWSSAGEINDVKPPGVLARGHLCNFLFMRSLALFFSFLSHFCLPCSFRFVSIGLADTMLNAPSPFSRTRKIQVLVGFFSFYFHLRPKTHQNIVEPKESNKIMAEFGKLRAKAPVITGTSQNKREKRLEWPRIWRTSWYVHRTICNDNITTIYVLMNVAI